MKKLVRLSIIAALFMFVCTTSVSAGEILNGFHGVYEMTANGSCLHSTDGFDFTASEGPPRHIPKEGSIVWAATTMAQGTWVFKNDGTGQASGTNYVIDFPPNGFCDTPAARWNAFLFNFSYAVTLEGEITVTLPNEFQFEGMVSKDLKTITLGSVNQIIPTSIQGNSCLNNTAICNIGRVLIRVDSK